MVTDNQVRMLMKLVNQEKLLKTAAAKAGMSEKTARKYRRSGKLPSQCKVIHGWRTRPDPLDQEDWHWVEEVLENNGGIEAKTLFEVLQREHPVDGDPQGLHPGEVRFAPFAGLIDLREEDFIARPF